MAESWCSWCDKTCLDGHLCFLKERPDNENFELDLDQLKKMTEEFKEDTINKDCTTDEFGHSNPVMQSRDFKLHSTIESDKNFSTTNVSLNDVENPLPLTMSQCPGNQNSLDVLTFNSVRATKMMQNYSEYNPVNLVLVPIETSQGNLCEAYRYMLNPPENVSTNNESVWITGTGFQISRGTCHKKENFGFNIENETKLIHDRKEVYLDSKISSLRCSEGYGNVDENHNQKHDIEIRSTTTDKNWPSDCAFSVNDTNSLAICFVVDGVDTHTQTICKEKTFVCNICGKGFGEKRHLNRHNRTHTGEKPFACLNCGKGFTDQGTLRKHLRIHTGEKPFICRICSKEFSRKSNLTVHIRTHTGEKPFECPVCLKRFNHQSIVKKHIRIHTGEKPFVCQICGKRFTRKCILNNHRQTHKGEKT